MAGYRRQRCPTFSVSGFPGLGQLPPLPPPPGQRVVCLLSPPKWLKGGKPSVSCLHAGGEGAELSCPPYLLAASFLTQELCTYGSF